jgi:hypothetical protein
MANASLVAASRGELDPIEIKEEAKDVLNETFRAAMAGR